jgi:carbonic anhydrase
MWWFIGHGKKARYIASFFSHSVTSGLLAAIAVILAISRIPTFTGVKYEALTTPGILKEVVSGKLLLANWSIVAVTIGTFALLVLLSYLSRYFKVLKTYPPQFWTIGALFVVGLLVPLPEAAKVSIPSDLTQFHHWPDFDLVAMWKDGVLYAFGGFVITLLVVDTAESVATVMAIDRLDRFRRHSDVDRVVGAMGIANIISGFLGGMSNIPGGAKSTMSAAVGATTVWASIFCAGFVFIEVLVGRSVMNLLPLSGLAAVIIYTVGKLCAPAVWKHFWKAGKDQFSVFFATFAISVATGDIFKGLVAGVLVQLMTVFVLSLWVTPKATGVKGLRNTLRVIWKLWTNPLVDVRQNGTIVEVHFQGIWLFFKPLKEVLQSIPQDAKEVRFHVTDEVLVMDHPTLERLQEICHIHKDSDTRRFTLSVCDKSLSRFFSENETGTRYRKTTFVKV